MSDEDDELAIALVRARKEFRCDLVPNEAERLIRRVSYWYSLGRSFRDSVNQVLNPTEFPDRRTRLGYKKVVKTVLGRRGGQAAAARRAA